MLETGQHPIHPYDWKAIRRFILYCLASIAVLFVVGWFYHKLLAPLFAAAFIAYLLDPLVDWLERLKINRSIATLIIVLTIGGLVTFAVIRILPFFYDQLMGLIQQVPSLVDNLAKNALKTLREVLRQNGLKDYGALDKALKSFNLLEQVLTRLQGASQSFIDAGAGLMGSLLNLVLTPLLTFYLVSEKASLKLMIRRVTPRDLRPYGKKAISIIDETLTNVIRGHMKVAMVLALLYSVGFSVIGLSAGVAIGITAGICRVIPYLDILVGMTLGVTYIFTEQLPTVTVLWLVSIIAMVQMLDGILITPKLIGSKVGLHPMVVILTILAASSKFGFWGVILAIPGAAIIKAFYKAVLPVYRSTRWFEN